MKGIFNKGARSAYSRGKSINIGSDIHLIIEGVVGLYSLGDGRRNFLFAFKKGEYFPYMSRAVSLASGRKFEYIALSKVSLLSIPKIVFQEEIKRPQKSALYVKYLEDIMELQVERIDNLGSGSVQERLVERLIFFASRLGTRVGDRVVINVPISHADIATSINTSRETVNRLVRKLEKQGLISVEKQIITIHSLAALRRLPT